MHKKCEGCGLKQPNFGLPAEGKKRWCAGCAKGHAGTEDLMHKKCEDCGLKWRHYGLPAEGKVGLGFRVARWCGGCAKGHAGAENVYKKKCEGCQLKWPSFGLPSEGKKARWCCGCAPKGATSNGKLPEKTQKAAEPRCYFGPLDLCSGSRYRLAIGNPYEAPPEPGSGCARRYGRRRPQSRLRRRNRLRPKERPSNTRCARAAS
jgi:hypothetical protein